MEGQKFDQNAYINKYKREHYSAFRVELKKEEMEELNNLLNKHKLTKSQFLRDAIKNLKSK